MLKFPLKNKKIAETTIQYILLYLLTGEITRVYGTITLYFESRKYLKKFNLTKSCPIKSSANV